MEQGEEEESQQERAKEANAGAEEGVIPARGDEECGGDACPEQERSGRGWIEEISERGWRHGTGHPLRCEGQMRSGMEWKRALAYPTHCEIIQGRMTRRRSPTARSLGT